LIKREWLFCIVFQTWLILWQQREFFRKQSFLVVL